MSEDKNRFWTDSPSTREFIEFLSICAKHGDLPPLIAEQMIKRIKETENNDRGVELTPQMKQFSITHDIEVGFYEHSCRIVFSCNKCANTWEPIVASENEKNRTTDFLWEDNYYKCPNGCNNPQK
jgi:hypothetical protein